MEGFPGFFRVRVGGYRIGVSIHRNDVAFLRLMTRQGIYREFP
jgi:mRNA-degrading endonuclease RelE of RelBE toxin-antitoxin system